MAFAGTSVTRGRGLGVVVHTGEASQLGRLAERTREVGTVRTPIRGKMDHLGKLIGVGILAVAGVVAGEGHLRDMTLHEIVQTAVALAVAAVPERCPWSSPWRWPWASGGWPAAMPSSARSLPWRRWAPPP